MKALEPQPLLRSDANASPHVVTPVLLTAQQSQCFQEGNQRLFFFGTQLSKTSGGLAGFAIVTRDSVINR